MRFTSEEEHFPIDQPDPIDAIRLRMDQMGLRNKDLVPYIGSAPDFWFTLLHELLHVALHLDGSVEWFVDDERRELTQQIVLVHEVPEPESLVFR